MAKDIRIGVASDTREFATGVQKGVIKPLDDVDKALDDVARGGDEAGRKLEKSLDGAGRETSEFKKAQQDLARTIGTTQQQGTQAIALNAGQRTKITRQAVRQAGAAAKTSLAGDIAAMDGTAQGALGAIGNTAGGILAAFGPIGAGIGVAVGVATGLVAGLLQKGTERTKEFKENVKQLTLQLIDSRDKGGPALDDLVSKLKVLASESDPAKTSLADLSKIAGLSGIGFGELTNAYVENGKSAKNLLQNAKDLVKGYESVMQASAETGATASKEASDRYLGAQLIVKAFESQVAAADEARKAESLVASTDLKEWELKAQTIKSVNAAYDEAANGAQKFIDKETGVFDADKFVASMLEREEALESYQENLAQVDLSPAAKAYIDGQGTEAAASFLAGYVKAGPETKRELNRIWSEAGKENSGSYKTTLKTGLGGTVRGPRVTLETPNADVILRGLQRQLDRTGLVVKAGVFTRNGDRIV